VDDIRLDREIRADKLGGIGAVSEDATDLGGSKEHVLRSFALEEFTGGGLVGKIKLSMRPEDEILISASA
jgi:hypothetical protein